MSVFFWNQNPHVVGSLHRWQSIHFLCQKRLPSLQLSYADQNHRELYSVGMDDPRTNLFRHCCSWDTPHQCSQFSGMIFFENIFYPSIELLSWMTFDSPHVKLWQLDFTWRLSKVIQEKSSMEGYKVIFENWEYWWVVSQLHQWRKRLCVCRPSRQNREHDGFDRRKQAVKMTNVFGIEKI